MLNEQEAIERASEHLRTDSPSNFRFHSIAFVRAADRPGRYKSMGDTWVVRFEEVLPAGLYDLHLQIVNINAETGEPIDVPQL